MDTSLKHRLTQVARRFKSMQLGWGLAALWIAFAMLGFLFVLARRQGAIAFPELPWIWLASMIVLAVCFLIHLQLQRNDLMRVAQRIEDEFPALNQGLITAAGIRPGENGRMGFLQRSVVSSAIRHDVLHGWRNVVSGSSVLVAWLSNIPALLLVLCVGVALWKPPGASTQSLGLTSRVAPLPRLTEVEVQPGNTEVERNSSLIVTARFNEDEVPDQVWLESWPAAGFESLKSGDQGDTGNKRGPNAEKDALGFSRITMRQSLKDPVFAAYLYDIDEALNYRITHDKEHTSSYRIGVFEYPALVRADAVLDFPSYTNLASKTIVDTRRIVAAKGTLLTWRLELNKAVELAELTCAQDEPLQLKPVDASGTQVEVDIDLIESRDWKLRLVDSDGRENSTKITLRAKVQPNKAATIRLTAGGDTIASPLEELRLAAKLKDDYSVMTAGIGYQIGGGDVIEEVAFESSDELTKSRDIEKIIDLESLSAKPRDLLSYYVWAEDFDDSGEIRRVVSDMYFAEVRPFEEIFREGDQGQQQQQQQQGQGQQGNQQTEELLELQKQIVIGSWNTLKLARREKLIGRARPDIVTIQESQQQAVELLQAKAEEANVEGAEQIIAAAREQMTIAIERLGIASDSLAKADLQKALSSEQAAFQELLRLQNKEFEVSEQQQQQQQSRSQSSRSQQRQQQIDQLRLENDMNRYEDERQAQEEQNDEQAELRQIISRLRELAERQRDINEQLRELEAALQAAETEEEREELQKQLERLREQQQELLQDSDEVQERMESSESEAVQDLQDKMEQARENIQQSTESLRQGNPSQAIASGARAEQELSELREEAREQAANQFSETMQSMRDRASDLQQQQEEIVEQLNGANSEERKPGLRSENDTGRNVAEQVGEQREELERLLEQIQQTVLEAEDTEPLLADKLYEAHREAVQQRATERLDVTEKLLEQGLEPQARELAEASVEDLQNLSEQIGDAAEAVLGSEVQSLQRALNQIESLSDQIETEIADATGQPSPDSEDTPAESNGQAGNPGESSELSDLERMRGSSQSAPNTFQESQGLQGQDSEQAEGQEEGRQEQKLGDGNSETDNNEERAENNPNEGLEQQDENSDQQNGQSQPGQGQNDQGQQQPNQRSETGDLNRAPADAQPQQGEGQQQPSQGQGSSSQTGQQSGSERQNNNSQQQRGQQQNESESQDARPSGIRGGSDNSQPTALGASSTWSNPNPRPLTGDEFRNWSDRLRDVEELVIDPELRWQATQIRQSAREIRRDLQKHGVDPKWAEVEDLVAKPLRELKQKVSEELIRRAAEKTEIVPIDRDPVPAEFSRSVRKYYENLGIGN